MTVQLKERVGRKAVDYIKSGMTVGLGTGSTAFYFIDELGIRLRNGDLSDITAVATSRRTRQLAKDRGIHVVPLDAVQHIDVTVDGADEVTRSLAGIKGGGGALLYEKIVAQYTKKVIWIVTEDKVVETLGAFPLPVEVTQFGCWNLFRVFKEAGMHPSFRKSGEDSLFITDAGNYIIDLNLEKIHAPAQLNFELNQLVGVVDHGLFLEFADLILVATADGQIETITKEK